MSAKHLTAKEQELLKEWQEKEKKPSLSTALSVKLFELFLHGVSCQEISALNKGTYLVEQILEARVRDSWDERRNEYLDGLFGSIVGKVSQVQAESVGFLVDMLSAAHKKHGKKLRKYLQTGDEKDLGDFQIHGFQNYRGVVETLLKVTGQDKDRGTLPTSPGIEDTKVVKSLPAGGVKVLDVESAASLLGALTSENNE